MPAPIYTGTTPTAAGVALTAATAKSVLGVKAHANSGILLRKFKVAFDGVTASAVPVYVEIGYCTFATNSPGTNSTSLTAPAVSQTNGRVITAGFTMAHTWTGGNEPTVVTSMDSFLLTPNGGVVFYDYPLGDEPDSALAEGFVIRCTAPATVNVRASMSVSRC